MAGYQVVKKPENPSEISAWKELGLGSRTRILTYPSGLVIKELERTCPDCGQDFPNLFIVTDDLWKEFGVGKGVLCLSCFEKRMGRALTINDLKDCPVNELALKIGGGCEG